MRAPIRLLPAALLALAACGSDNDQVFVTVGATGGEVTFPGATLRFPPNALSAETSISLRRTEDEAPAGFVALSKVFECGPSGLDFPVPVEMQMDFVADGGAATMLWSSGSDPSFKDVGGTVDGATMRADVRHFSRGFVGRVVP